MPGEASHGTEEFYTWRAAITRRLVAEHGFHVIAVEGDWSSSMAVNRYIKAHPDGVETAREALAHVDRRLIGTLSTRDNGGLRMGCFAR